MRAAAAGAAARAGAVVVMSTISIEFQIKRDDRGDARLQSAVSVRTETWEPSGQRSADLLRGAAQVRELAAVLGHVADFVEEIEGGNT